MNLNFSVHGVGTKDNYIIMGTEPLNARTCVSGELSRLPGSPSIWVSHNLIVPKGHRGKGYSNEYNQKMLELAWFKLDASAVIASIKKDNFFQHGRLTGLGWERISNAIWIIRPPTEWSNV